MAVFWDITLCGLIEVHRRFIALIMEAAGASVTSVNFYQNTGRNISEDSHIWFLFFLLRILLQPLCELQVV
jgi:hypothetical protein